MRLKVLLTWKCCSLILNLTRPDDYFTLNFSIPYGLWSCLWYRLPQTTALVWVSSRLAFCFVRRVVMATRWGARRSRRSESQPGGLAIGMSCGFRLVIGGSFYFFTFPPPLSLSLLSVSLGLFILTIVATTDGLLTRYREVGWRQCVLPSATTTHFHLPTTHRNSFKEARCL